MLRVSARRCWRYSGWLIVTAVAAVGLYCIVAHIARCLRLHALLVNNFVDFT